MHIFDSPTISALVGGFAGAVFAFIFLQLSHFLAYIFRRNRKHYRELAVLESNLNKLLDESKRHTDAVISLADMYSEISPPSLVLTYSLPHQLKFSFPEMGTLKNIDLINDLHSFDCKIRRVNGDTQAIAEGYVHQRDLAIEDRIPPDQYVALCRSNESACRVMIPFSDKLTDEIVTLLAKIRVLSEKDKPIISRVLRSNKYGNSFNELATREKLELLREINSHASESQSYIDDALDHPT